MTSAWRTQLVVTLLLRELRGDPVTFFLGICFINPEHGRVLTWKFHLFIIRRSNFLVSYWLWSILSTSDTQRIYFKNSSARDIQTHLFQLEDPTDSYLRSPWTLRRRCYIFSWDMFHESRAWKGFDMVIPFIHNSAIKFLKHLLIMIRTINKQKAVAKMTSSTRFCSRNELHAFCSEPNGVDPSLYLLAVRYQIFLRVKRIEMHLGPIQKIELSIHAKILVTRAPQILDRDVIMSAYRFWFTFLRTRLLLIVKIYIRKPFLYPNLCGTNVRKNLIIQTDYRITT